VHLICDISIAAIYGWWWFNSYKHVKAFKTSQQISTPNEDGYEMCVCGGYKDVWIKMVSLWRISNDDLATTDHTLLEKGKHEAWRPRMFVMEKSKWILESDGSRWPWRITYTSKYQLFMNQKHEMIWIESGFLIIWSENS
jgi:hypothetical protein